MATISVTFLDRTFQIEYPDVLQGSILDDLCARYGYQNYVPNPNPGPTEPPMIANPEDKMTFVINRVVQELLQPSKEKVRRVAMEQAQVQADAQISQAFGNVTITEPE
jgi:hypothetical protein